MRIVITGAAGFIGSNLALRLLQENHEVIGIDNFLSSVRKNVEELSKYSNFTFYERDVIEPAIMDLDGKVDWIMHLACPASPVHYLKHPIETLRVNSEGTFNLLELARKKEAKFFYTSTSEVYGDPGVHPQPESYWGHVNPNGPRSVYDESKRYAESLILTYHKEFDVPIRIVRIFNTYGPRMALNDGRAITNFLLQALRGEPIMIYGDGKQTRSFQYIDDLLNGIIALMNAEYYKPINIGNPEEYTLLQVAQLIKEMTGSHSEIQHLPCMEDDPKQRRPDITLANKVLNWAPQVSLQTGLEKMIEWMAPILADKETSLKSSV